MPSCFGRQLTTADPEIDLLQEILPKEGALTIPTQVLQIKPANALALYALQCDTVCSVVCKKAENGVSP